jgi:hypothetical protein
MDHDQIDAVRDRHPAWRLMRADNAPLVLSFIGSHFVEDNQGARPAGALAQDLDDVLRSLAAAGDPDHPSYPKRAEAYLADWSADGVGWLRRFYPTGSDEVHFDATPAFEKAYAWVTSLQARPFVGTESRLTTAVELLRQIVHGSEADPDARLAELRRRREELDRQIERAEAGLVDVLEPTAVRERYHQFASTARDLLADFREVEDNFRALDRSARERIAAWTGSKGELLGDLVGSRADIAGSDQGRSFQAFYDFLLSETRQQELATLLSRVLSLDALEPDPRLRTVHHDWSDAAERTQRTVRQLSEQLRRFLDDQVWLDNRRVLDLARSIEAAALACRDSPPPCGIEVDEPGLTISLPFERPLYDARPAVVVDSLLDPDADHEVDIEALFSYTHVDPGRLAAQVRTVVPDHQSALLSDIVALFPVEQGAAEVVAYLTLGDDLEVTMDETEEMLIDYEDGGSTRRIRLPMVTVRRR